MKNHFVLIDTSIWIEALSKNGDKKIKSISETLLLEQRTAIAPLIKLELLSGALNKTEFKNLKQELDSLEQLEITEKIWNFASEIGFTFRRKGLKTPNSDLLIAAISIHYECQLWHKDKHFNLIAKHFPLKIYSI